MLASFFPPAPTQGCSRLPSPQPPPLLSACYPSHVARSVQPTKEKTQVTNPGPVGGRRRGWRAELKACTAQLASLLSCRRCLSPRPLAPRTPCQGRMEDLDALLAELEQSSCPASKDRMLQTSSSPKQDLAANRPPDPRGCEPLASVALKVPPQAQAPAPKEALKTVYSPTPVPQPLLPSPPPVTAAQQLDELLADLGHMQSKLAAVGQGAGVPAEPLLDNMLGSLTRDLQELGITATPTGVCGFCCKPIAGKVLTALGKTWHPEHFTCARCGQELGGRPFFERGGQAYCEEDYHQAFSPRCAYCAGPIREKVLTALDQTWHPEHFFCAHCGKVFGDDGFHERSGKPYCHQDFLAMFAPKCQGCERPVTDNYLSALQGVWHSECFVCAECMSSFASGSFFELEGRPYCELHFHQRQGSICHGCGRPVTGRCITAAGRKYHPEHFICAYCLGQLQKGTFREHGNKMYCQACHDKLFL
ncbi:leupaxin-like isoform X2 [Balearica regulorum gibbericeps]|uniref:leupaxin-like isoform X2 n=1 Tax=Balearica regulorum gibbericeps TaxID=100784 RepID=UPI003F5E2972